MSEQRAASPESTTVVWFKRDLRVVDHRPLVEAAQTGAVVALYVYESDLIAQAESESSHYVFSTPASPSSRRSSPNAAPG